MVIKYELSADCWFEIQPGSTMIKFVDKKSASIELFDVNDLSNVTEIWDYTRLMNREKLK